MANREPIAVVISDVHYSLATMEVADKAMRMAIRKAAELAVPLIVAGDLINDKAILRAEYVNKIIQTLEWAKKSLDIQVVCLVGNHDLLNEKSEDNALDFILPYAQVVRSRDRFSRHLFLIPYQTSADKFYEALDDRCDDGSIVIAHQGTIGGQLGDYIKDSTAFDPAIAAKKGNPRIFLGHYHNHYELGNTVSIGNPYTLSFGEAGDAPKGFLVIYSDGSYERVLTNLRVHRKMDVMVNVPTHGEDWSITSFHRPEVWDGDILWVKAFGPQSELAKINKEAVALSLNLRNTNFKLDLIKVEPEDAVVREIMDTIEEDPASTNEDLLDALIDMMEESADYKKELKDLWRTLCG